MSLETVIDPRLWEAVKSNYEDRDYTGAILDAMHFLSDLLRGKSGANGDGVALIGQALGGKNPLLKINRLQTETEKSIQSGIEQIMRGMYQAIRNPRSHEKYDDSKENSDAIIMFLNYLVRIVDKSSAPFSKSVFMKRVFDPDFVESDRYATLLVKEIPVKQRLDICIDVYRQKESGIGKKLRFFFHALHKRMDKQERTEFYRIVSDELKETNDEAAIRTTIQILPHQCWEKYSEQARLRIENKLIQSIKDGRFDKRTQECLGGALGTWANGIHKYFRLKSSLVNALIDKLESTDRLQQNYTFRYFFECLPNLLSKPTRRLQLVILKGLNSGDKRFYDAISYRIMVGPEEWRKVFSEAYNKFKEKPLRDEEETPEEDIPF